MYCSFCGAVLMDGARFCTWCGKSALINVIDDRPDEKESGESVNETAVLGDYRRYSESFPHDTASTDLTDFFESCEAADGKTTADRADVSQSSKDAGKDYIDPIIINGKLTCPVCGEGNQPINRTRCWKCAVRFANDAAAAAMRSGVPAIPEITEKEAIRRRDQAIEREKQRIKEAESIDKISGLLVAALIISIISSIMAPLPVARVTYNDHLCTAFDVDSFTSAMTVVGMILGPLLLGGFLAVGNSRYWALLWCSLVANVFTLSGVIAAMITFSESYHEKTAIGWIGVLASVTAEIIIMKAMGRIKDQVEYLKMHMK